MDTADTSFESRVSAAFYSLLLDEDVKQFEVISTTIWASGYEAYKD